MELAGNEKYVYLTQVVPSFYVTVSSISGHIINFIKDRFPKDYFKAISFEDASTANQMLKNENSGAKKISFPNLVISTSIPTESPDSMERFNLMSSNLFMNKNLRGNYPPLLSDPEGFYNGGFSFEWRTIQLNFKIIVDTYIQNMNLVQYINSAIQLDQAGYLDNVILQFEIPKTIIKMLASLEQIDLENKEDFSELSSFLLGIGRNHSIIEKKIDATTGQATYYAGIIVSPIIYVENLDAANSIQKSNGTETEYVVSFTVRCITPIPNNFILKIDRNKIAASMNRTTFESLLNEQEIQQLNGISAIRVDIPANKQDVIHFKSSKNDSQEYIGSFVLEERFTYGSNNINRIPKKIELFEYANDWHLKRVHAYCIENNIDLEQIFHIQAYKKAWKNGLTSFEINYENFEVTIDNPEFSEIIIRLFINRPSYESIIKAMKDDNFFYNSNALCHVNIQCIINEEKTVKKVKVNFFNSKKEMFSLSYDKMLCIKTKYGLGYLNIKKIDDISDISDKPLICLDLKEDMSPVLYELILE